MDISERIAKIIGFQAIQLAEKDERISQLEQENAKLRDALPKESPMLRDVLPKDAEADERKNPA